MATLHPPSAVFSRRHVPTWLLLAFAAGAVNAIGFLACSRFVTHVTGTVSLIGMDVGSILLSMEYGAVLLSFIGGAMTSAALIEGRQHRNKQPLHAMALVAVSALLTALAIGGVFGVFGKFGGAVETSADFAFLSMLAFAMGLQNAAVSTSTGLLVRTTHMTGPAADLGVHLVNAVYSKGEVRNHALRNAMLRGGKIAAFAFGGAVGAGLAIRVNYLAFLAPAAAVILATGLSFVRSYSLTHPLSRVTSKELAS